MLISLRFNPFSDNFITHLFLHAYCRSALCHSVSGCPHAEEPIRALHRWWGQENSGNESLIMVAQAMTWMRYFELSVDASVFNIYDFVNMVGLTISTKLFTH